MASRIQAYLFCRHRKLPPAEREYFTTLVEYERASDRNYRDHLEAKISELRSSNELLAERLKRPPPITSGTQNQTYFSAWQYSAIHFMTACPSFQSAEVIAHRLSLPAALVRHVLAELASWGMVREEGTRWQYDPSPDEELVAITCDVFKV